MAVRRNSEGTSKFSSTSSPNKFERVVTVSRVRALAVGRVASGCLALRPNAILRLVFHHSYPYKSFLMSPLLLVDALTHCLVCSVVF